MILWLLSSIAFGWLVKYRVAEGSRFRAIGSIAVDAASIPSTLAAIVRGTKTGEASSTRLPRPDGFASPRTKASQDYFLAARYLAQQNRYVVQLLRVPDNIPLRTYAPDIIEINGRSKLRSPLLNLARDRAPNRYRLSHPLLMEDGGLIFQDSGPLVRIDACSKVIWTLDGIFHHSIERDADGILWVPYTPAASNRPGVRNVFRDDGLARISPDGRLLSVVLLMDILRENGLAYIVESQPYADDPLHLNDIEPILETGPFWSKGDVFLSLRHQSLVMLYRPSTGKVIWHKQGPWRMQHDINVIDKNRISVFDNRVKFSDKSTVDESNNIIIYDFISNTIDESWVSAFRDNDIRTVTQGRGTPLPNGDFFVEETENGRALRMSKDGTLRWDYVTANSEMERLYLAWSRFIDFEKDSKAIEAARTMKCH
jgi:Arylsulfotransferase (ASST)